DSELIAKTSLPCLALIPKTKAGSINSATTDSEVGRILAAAGNTDGPPAASKLLLVTSSLPGEGKSLLAASIMQLLDKMGSRTLTIDYSRNPEAIKKDKRFANAVPLERVLVSFDLLPVNAEQQHSSMVLFSQSLPEQAHALINSADFSNFVSRVRNL